MRTDNLRWVAGSLSVLMLLAMSLSRLLLQCWDRCLSRKRCKTFNARTLSVAGAPAGNVGSMVVTEPFVIVVSFDPYPMRSSKSRAQGSNSLYRIDSGEAGDSAAVVSVPMYLSLREVESQFPTVSS